MYSKFHQIMMTVATRFLTIVDTGDCTLQQWVPLCAMFYCMSF